MKTIRINNEVIKVSLKTFKRIEKIASEKNLSFSEAVLFLLEQVN